MVTLIACSTRSKGRRGRLSYHSKRYYLPDIRWVEEQLRNLEDDIADGKEDAQQALDDFVAERKAVAKEVLEVNLDCPSVRWRPPTTALFQNAHAIEEWEKRHEVFEKEEDKRLRARRKDECAAFHRLRG